MTIKQLEGDKLLNSQQFNAQSQNQTAKAGSCWPDSGAPWDGSTDVLRLTVQWELERENAAPHLSLKTCPVMTSVLSLCTHFGYSHITVSHLHSTEAKRRTMGRWQQSIYCIWTQCVHPALHKSLLRFLPSVVLGIYSFMAGYSHQLPLQCSTGMCLQERTECFKSFLPQAKASCMDGCLTMERFSYGKHYK